VSVFAPSDTLEDLAVGTPTGWCGGAATLRGVDEDLDFSLLTNQDLKDRIATLCVDSELAQRKLDVMRAELVNRLRAAGGGPDEPSGVREPRRPTRPTGTGAIPIPRPGGEH
jgi:hypothetical protein